MTEDIILEQLVFAQESMEIKRYTDKDFNDNQKSQTIFYLINSNEKKKKSHWRKTSGNKDMIILLRQSRQSR